MGRTTSAEKIHKRGIRASRSLKFWKSRKIHGGGGPSAPPGRTWLRVYGSKKHRFGDEHGTVLLFFSVLLADNDARSTDVVVIIIVDVVVIIVVRVSAWMDSEKRD